MWVLRRGGRWAVRLAVRLSASECTTILEWVLALLLCRWCLVLGFSSRRPVKGLWLLGACFVLVFSLFVTWLWVSRRSGCAVVECCCLWAALQLLGRRV